MPLEHTSCPLCSATDLKLEFELEDYSISKERFKVSRCTSCDFLFTQNPPTQEEAGRYYQSEDYISHSDTSKGFINSLYHKVRDIMLGKKYKLVRKLTSGKNLLDIGTGTGYFLNFMKTKGYDTVGIEIDKDTRNYGIKKFGLDIHAPSELLDGKLSQKFNVITLWHVLEHLYNFEEYLTKIKEQLEDDGVVLIAVPNEKSFEADYHKEYWAAYDVPRHLWHFSPATMTKLAGQNGFKISGMYGMPFDPFYNSLLSEKYKGRSLQLITGFFAGLLGYLSAAFNPERNSSLIYVLRKNS